ncbi:MAG: class II fructose-bisphosphate aldolase [Propionibacteriaceae bacterium]|jgi:fructose-bisphosphate aldolase class II|nr:class II fructose-bisphosphate aldolase [Propionibacteriaceae bacterium]
MAIILGKPAVTAVYAAAAARGWVVPTFCAENQTTIEAILGACQAKAAQTGSRVPVTVAMTGRYGHRPQAVYYAGSGNPQTGLELFLGDCEVLARADGDYPDVDVLTHFDHGQPDEDAVWLAGDLSRFSSVMFDASALAWAENLARTAEFVARQPDVLVEGAADEVVDATGSQRGELTSPERAEEFVTRTGVDMVVANLGTEHRASAADLKYHPEAARAIAARIGCKLVLHGASSVPVTQLKTLRADGVCKVNIWTTLERDTSPVLLRALVGHADAVAGPVAAELAADGLLGPAAPVTGRADIAYFTTAWRQHIVGQAMQSIVARYLDIWY